MSLKDEVDAEGHGVGAREEHRYAAAFEDLQSVVAARAFLSQKNALKILTWLPPLLKVFEGAPAEKVRRSDARHTKPQILEPSSFDPIHRAVAALLAAIGPVAPFAAKVQALRLPKISPTGNGTAANLRALEEWSSDLSAGWPLGAPSPNQILELRTAVESFTRHTPVPSTRYPKRRRGRPMGTKKSGPTAYEFALAIVRHENSLGGSGFVTAKRLAAAEVVLRYTPPKSASATTSLIRKWEDRLKDARWLVKYLRKITQMRG